MSKAKDLPHRRNDFDKKRGGFNAWLLSNGSAIYEPTNPYEVARFQTMQGIGIVYADGADMITSWMNGAAEAMLAFLNGKPWRGTKATKRKGKSVIDYHALSKRDGTGCMYCAKELDIDTFTIEHVVPITAQGPNHLSNKALACFQCNHEAGHLSAREKLEMAIRKRATVEPPTPEPAGSN
jgi:hypothetical protein